MVNGSIPNRPARLGHARCGRHHRCTVPWFLSPHPGPLPWGEGEPLSPCSTIRTFRLSLRCARCSLSLRERDRVRGNGANKPTRVSDYSGNVELDKLSGEAGGFSK